jgi:hypothetical protein
MTGSDAARTPRVKRTSSRRNGFARRFEVMLMVGTGSLLVEAML